MTARFLDYGIGAQRDLHSFPTRRSSDLSTVVGLSDRCSARIASTRLRTMGSSPSVGSSSNSSGGRWASARTSCRSEEHTSELQSRLHLVCRLLLEKKKRITDRVACRDGS